MPDSSITKMALAASMKELMEQKDFSRISVARSAGNAALTVKVSIIIFVTNMIW